MAYALQYARTAGASVTKYVHTTLRGTVHRSGVNQAASSVNILGLLAIADS